jgi:catechol 2,3-dioxygenase-like lactoylglutathione lyase family enzyme
VLDAVRHGLSQRQIAVGRRISRDAVKYHVDNIRGKLGASSMAELRLWRGYPAASGARAVRRTMDDLSLGPIGQVSLLVRDAASARRFYSEVLGLPHLYSFGDLVFVDAGGTRLFLRAVPEAEWRPSSTLYFRVASIDAAWTRLLAREVHPVSAPHMIHRHDDGTEEWMAFFDDGEGNTLALMSSVAPETARVGSGRSDAGPERNAIPQR